MPTLSVRCGNTTGSSAIGETIMVDFSGDCTGTQNVVGYAVGLTGFTFNYLTNSVYYAENMGMLGVRLTPNLVDNQLFVTASAVMTDYDGDAGQAPAGSGSDPACQVWFTAVALIDDSAANASKTLIGNVYGLPNGTSQTYAVPTDQSFSGSLLSGFSIQASGSPGSLSSLNASLSDTLSSSNAQMTISASASAGGMSTSATVDAMILSLPPAVDGYMIQYPSITYGSAEKSGLTAFFDATFQVPEGYTISNAGAVLQSVNLDFGGTDEFQLAYVQPIVTFVGSSVTGTILLDFLNPDFGSRTYISQNTTITMYVIAQISAN